jgi:hypothetical protein
MQATTIVCPGCHRAMALKQAPPPGARLGCPACGTVLPTPPGGDWTASARPVAPAPIVPQPRPRTALAPVPAPQPVVPFSQTPAPATRPFPPLLVVSLLAGVFLLVAGGSLILFLVLDARKKKELGGKDLASKETLRTTPSQPVAPTEPTSPNPPRIVRPQNDDPDPGPVRPPVIQPGPQNPVDDPPPQRVDPAPGERPRLTNGEQEKVNKAIEKGLDYLSHHPIQANDPYALGTYALVGLTLLECGIPANDPRVQRAAAVVRIHAPNSVVHPMTYQTSLCLLFLDRLGDPKDEGLIQNMGLRLVAGQGPTGGWGYNLPVISGAEEKAFLVALRGNRPRDANGRGIPPADRPDPPKDADPETVRKALASLSPTLRSVPALWGPDQKITPPSDRIGNRASNDNSNTQFAAMALWVAGRHGVPIDRTMLLLGERFRISQGSDGGWSYWYDAPVHSQPGVPEAMTGAGLLGLAVAHGVTPDRAPNDRKAEQDAFIQAGLQRFGSYVGTPRGPERMKDPGTINIYFLWTLERVAVLYHLETLNGKDWYAWGAELLLDHQDAKGCWSGSNYPGSEATIDTCFALLFLKRANLIKDLSKKLEHLIEAKDPGNR